MYTLNTVEQHAVSYSVAEQQQISDWVDAVNSSAKHQQDLIGTDMDVARTLAPGTHASGPHLTKTLVTGNCLNPWDVQSKHIQPEDGIAESLYAAECRYGGGESYVMQTTPASYQDTTGAMSVVQPMVLESNQNHATVQTDGICTTLPASMGMGGYVPMVVDSTSTSTQNVIYAIDRASFNQGKNAKYDFSIQKDVAQTLVARGPGGVMVSEQSIDKYLTKSDTVGALCASDYKGAGNQYIEDGNGLYK